ncbi:penicillin-binding transpeptidase domain-containing protein [Streptomyces sp. NPDC051129]
MHTNHRPTTALVLALAFVASTAAACGILQDDSTSGGVDGTARTFLSAWQAGDLEKAARLTTSPDQARTELTAYRDKTGVVSVQLTPDHAEGDTVSFKAVARLAYHHTKATWQYTSRLAVVNDPTTDHLRVSWHSSVIHPTLPGGGGYTLRAFTRPAPTVITDRHGNGLTTHDQPGLTQVLAQLQDRYAGEGHQALGIRLSSASDGGGGRIVATLDTGKAARLRTRLDTGTQQAVDTAASRYPGAAAVVIQPSTGDVLAVHTTEKEFDPALEGVQAPGQAFELVTAAALLEHGAVTPRTRVGCPASATYGGRTFTNPGGWTSQDAPFAEVFTHACDTGYVRLADEVTGRDLASEARDVFGLGLDWQTGVNTADGAVPELNGADKAAAAIGRGEVRLNALNLASVAATVQSGTFRQPLLIDPGTSGKALARTRRSLPAHVRGDLRALMHAYADASGLAGAAFGGVADQFGDSGQPITGWFTASRGDLVLAVTAPEQTHEPKTAKAVATAVLDTID